MSVGHRHLTGALVPRQARTPFAAIMRRVGFAVGLIVFVAAVVRLGRSGYTDVTGDPISFLDIIRRCDPTRSS